MAPRERDALLLYALADLSYDEIACALEVPVGTVGTWLHLSEKHAHEHHHEAVTHEHWHTHDDGHHDHEHAPGELVAPGVRHRHVHTHEARTHTHEHYPDAHHRHDH